MDKVYVRTTVDFIHFNARHYVEMGDKAKAIAAIQKDHKHNDHFKEEKAAEYFDQMVKDVEKEDKKKDAAPVEPELPAALAKNKAQSEK